MMNRALPAQSEPLDNFAVAFRVRLAQIFEMTPPLTDQFQQATPRMLVMLVCAQMIRKLNDPGGQQCNLNFGGPGIAFMTTKILDDRFFFFFSQCHVPFFRNMSPDRSDKRPIGQMTLKAL